MARNKNTDKNSRENLQRQIASGRSSLLLILIFTVVNVLFVMLDVDRYFLFSASVPYYLTMLGKGLDNGFVDGPWDINGTFTITALVISVVILAVYLLCWLLSKKRIGWQTVALVLFIVDTLALVLFTFALYDSPAVNIMDFIFHIWVIATLIHAIRADSKLKKLPAQEETPLDDFSTDIPALGDDSESIF